MYLCCLLGVAFLHVGREHLGEFKVLVGVCLGFLHGGFVGALLVLVPYLRLALIVGGAAATAAFVAFAFALLVLLVLTEACLLQGFVCLAFLLLGKVEEAVALRVEFGGEAALVASNAAGFLLVLFGVAVRARLGRAFPSFGGKLVAKGFGVSLLRCLSGGCCSGS